MPQNQAQNERLVVHAAKEQLRKSRLKHQEDVAMAGGELGVVEEDVEEDAEGVVDGVVDKVVGKDDYNQKKTLNNVRLTTNSSCRYLIFTQLTYYYVIPMYLYFGFSLFEV